MADPTPTPSTATDTGPLDWRIAITDKGGRPTPEFQRRWNTQRNNNGLIGATVGHGAPVGVPVSDGLIYIDEDADPGVEYVSFDGAWHRVSVIKFKELQDVPQSYVGHAGNPLRVNSTEDGIEYTTVSGLLDEINNTRGDILYRGASGWVGLAPGTSGNFLKTNGAGADPAWAAVSGTGTVTSVALTAPSIFTVTGSPVTTSGTLAITLGTQSPNLIFAGPTTGAAAAPTFRSLVAADLPLATTGAFGAVKPDGTTVTISAGVISATGGSGGVATQTYSRPVAQAAWASGTSLFATKGNYILPAEPFSIGSVYVGMGSGAAGRQFSVNICQLTAPGTFTVAAILGTATATLAGTAAATIKFSFGSPISLAAGVAYIVSVTQTNAASGTTALGIQSVGTGVNTFPNYGNLPLDNTSAFVSENFQLAKTSVSVADTFVINNNAAFDIMLSTQLAAPVVPTGTANQVYATPNGSSGSATLRSLVGADLPLATTSAFGAVKPDGTTITIASGLISAPGTVTGTWTPVDASGAGITITNSGATYVKAGKLCLISVNALQYAANSSLTAAVIGGLPFAMGPTGAPTPILNISTIADPIFSFPNPGDGFIHLFKSGAAFGTVSNATVAGAFMYIQLLYETT